MKNNLSKLSNSFSTGGGGFVFERRVQAVFILSMLIEGVCPVLGGKTQKLIFQAKHHGIDTDDIVIFSHKNGSEMKMLCQIKHDITVSGRTDGVFQQVITAAWNDFHKQGFIKGYDKLALITGFISKDSISALRYIHDQAIKNPNATNFYNAISQSNFTRNFTRKNLKSSKTAYSIPITE